MEDRLQLSKGSIEVIPNGVNLRSYQVGKPKRRIGYLARQNEIKGLGLLVDAYIHLNDPSVELAIAGTMAGADAGYVSTLKEKLFEAGLAEHVSWHANLDLEEKATFLASLAVFSVPAIYPEAFGLYLVEAMASGIPVVMPRSSAFPEVLESSGAGLLVEPKNHVALAEGCLLYTSPSPRDATLSRMPSSA